MKVFHFSDIHYSNDKSENIRSMVDQVCSDISGKVSNEDFLIVSGDLVWAGSDKESFLKFKKEFINPIVERCGFSGERVVLCPGNHDLDTSRVGVGSMRLLYKGELQGIEAEEFYGSERSYFESLFENYHSLCSDAGRVGGNYFYDYESVSFLCINSSLFSVGGNRKLGEDDRRLFFTYSGLNDWFSERRDKTVCLVLHHPISWLAQECRDLIERYIKANVKFVFHGHEHKKDVVFRFDEAGGAHVFSAPALFSDDADRLGFCYLSIDDASEAVYRQWSPSNGCFVPGVDFSGNDSGVVRLSSPNVDDDEFVKRLYTRNLDEALRLFTDSGVKWVDRRISRTPEKNSFNSAKDIEFCKYPDIVFSDRDSVISAPPEYGLTSLGHSLCLESLALGKMGFLLCLKKQRIHSKELKLRVQSELEVLNKTIDNLDFLVVDSWGGEVVSNKKKAIEELKKAFPITRIIFLQTSDVSSIGAVSGVDAELVDAGVKDCFYLYSLARDEVRSGVKKYSENRDVRTGCEDQLVNKVISDFDFLNLPRTPLNCFTLLRVLESNIHDTPINRGDMVSRILSLIFYEIDYPTYSSRPDVKDCEYVLGFFCAKILKQKNEVFSREDFVRFSQAVCAKKYFTIDSGIIFDVLYRNRIIVSGGGGFRFRFFYWVNYFSAVNMVHDDAFRNEMLVSGGYISHPEIIDFYTGSDRKRDDALLVIKKDLDCAIDDIKVKVGEEGFFPYSEIKWVMNDDQQKALANHLDNEVSASSLPTQVKDEYSDRSYDPAKPYYQSVRRVLSLTSMRSLMNLVSCAGKALRKV